MALRFPLLSLASLVAAGNCFQAGAAPVLDQSHPVSQSVGGLIIDSGFSPAQSFTAGDEGLLSQVDLLLSRDSGDIGDLALEVWSFAAGAPAGSSPLFTTPIDPSVVSTGGASFVEVDVSAGGLFVSPGEQYVLAMTGTAVDNGPNAAWTWGYPEYTAGDTYYHAGSWTPLGGDYDFGFRTWVDPDASAGGDTLTVTPTFDVEAVLSGGDVAFFLDGADRIEVRLGPSNDVRGMIEFDVSGLPAGATVTGGTLELDPGGASGTHSLSPVVEVYGYAGDGVVRPANATNLSTPLGESDPVDSFDTISIPLAGAAINSLLSASDQLGLVLYQGSYGLHVDINTSEYHSRFPEFIQAPTLTLTYEAPATFRLPDGDFNGDAYVNAADYTVWRDALATGDLRADGDQDGDIDEQDYALWRNHFGTRPHEEVPNGGFETGGLNEWNVVVGANTSVSFGFPRVETFDVDGDGNVSDAMRVRLGRLDTNQTDGGLVTIEQELLLAGGDYEVAADIASQSLEAFGNTAPGNYSLVFDGLVVDQVILNGSLIDSMEVIRDSLAALLTDVQPGYHTLGIEISRGATNSRAIYQFIDNVSLTRVGGATAVPEPGAALLLIGAAAAACRPRNGEPAT